jgi:hypothetical protein
LFDILIFQPQGRAHAFLFYLSYTVVSFYGQRKIEKNSIVIWADHGFVVVMRKVPCVLSWVRVCAGFIPFRFLLSSPSIVSCYKRKERRVYVRPISICFYCCSVCIQ